jgi:hypothetical protein
MISSSSCTTVTEKPTTYIHTQISAPGLIYIFHHHPHACTHTTHQSQGSFPASITFTFASMVNASCWPGLPSFLSITYGAKRTFLTGLPMISESSLDWVCVCVCMYVFAFMRCIVVIDNGYLCQDSPYTYTNAQTKAWYTQEDTGTWQSCIVV